MVIGGIDYDVFDSRQKGKRGVYGGGVTKPEE